MSQKQYWQGLDQLNNSSAHQEVAENEFKEELPFNLTEDILGATTPRRDFLKFLGFSTLAATIVSSCEMPVRRAIPYAIKPEDIVPGVPNYYASTFTDGGDYCAIIIKTRDGRPIKVEGNTMSSVTKGGTSARVQASVLSLYDKARIRHPYADGQEATFDAIDRQVKAALASGKPSYIVTGTILSPTLKDVITQFTTKYPSVKHVVYDGISYSGMLQANEASYGKRTLPTYHFEKAQTIVSLGADFLGTWVAPIENAKRYSMGRKISAKNMQLSKHYQVESMHSLTGAAADNRATCKPSEMGAVAAALYNAVVSGMAPALSSPKLNAMITAAAADLKKGNGMVVAGTNDMNIQMVVNAINDKIGANGTTINWASTNNGKQGIDSDMTAMVAAMNAGSVGAVMFHNANPVYDYYDSKNFVAALGKVPVTVSFAERMDETAQKCKFMVPDHHYLESWGDAEPKPNYFSLAQPGIAPLFKTRALADTLLTWADATTNYADFWKNYWMTKLGGQDNFDKTLQNGIYEPAGDMPNGGAAFTGNVNDVLAKAQASKGSNGMELVIYQKVSIGHGGAWSNNPWLQEMPDPMTKATWDNYVCISPALAKKMDVDFTGFSEVDAKKRVLKVKSNGYEVELPAIVVPGMHNDVVAIAVGYGRDAKVGKASADLGKNAYPFLTLNGQNFEYNTAVTVEKTDKKYEVGLTQTHMSYEARPVVHEYTLEEFRKDPQVLIKERQEEIGEFAALPWEEEGKEFSPTSTEKFGNDPERTGANSDMEEGYRRNGTMFPDYVSPGIKWGMSIDLNSCIGCGACTVGCMAENNISVVGKTHVLLAHDMHWLRIDRYFSGMPDDADSIQTVFQPMLCQHCDNAPCENVCPVSATNHSSEGLNQMAYNRCIGTKYCANNCPYKVRHFNWMDWNGADCFDDNLYEDGRRDGMNDDLTRMVLNPDVTVRSRGVMEKCSFCVQRLQDAKLTAKKDGRPLRDGEAKTACQQACPTDAILFGNVNDKESAIYHLRNNEQRERTFYVLEHIHTLPNINYLAKIRNTNEIVAGNEKTDGLYQKHI